MHDFRPAPEHLARLLPEEQVRRQLVDWLVEQAGVPARLIAVEYSLSNLDPRSRKRADVVVWRPAESGGGLHPWLLAECKAPGVPLREAVVDQVRGYAEKIRADYVLLTNGTETPCFRLGNAGYLGVSGLPHFPKNRG